jgi:uncharacterized membrane protein YcaP (DUF421 family)
VHSPDRRRRDGDLALRRERVTEAEVRAAVRGHWIADLDGVEAVVLETDGSVSVLPRASQQARTSLEGVANWPDVLRRMT